MDAFIAIAQLVLAISALIILHEIGHFAAARLIKIEVEEFGLGFPPRAAKLFKWRGTEYSLNWLPLGGFVRIKGEGDPSIPDGLAAANPWKRIFVYAAGPAMNLLAAVVLYAILINQVGMADPSKVLILDVEAGSPAALAGLQADDLILRANQVEIDSTTALRDQIYANLDQEMRLEVLRDDEELTFTIVPRSNPPAGQGAIGILMGNPTQEIGWIEAIPYGAISTGNHIVMLATLPGEVIKGTIDPELARPVGYKGMYDIYQDVQEIETGPGVPASTNIIWFFTTITISLGVINLFPIPALDGGRILFALPEILIGRRIPIEWQNAVNMISFTLLILLFIYINILDFTNPVQLP
ncbi:MAG: site-2 protease family protein [Anaerolineales bacterium]|nr:site-2 protease family protein [Anaerolineales bacterium]